MQLHLQITEATRIQIRDSTRRVSPRRVSPRHWPNSAPRPIEAQRTSVTFLFVFRYPVRDVRLWSAVLLSLAIGEVGNPRGRWEDTNCHCEQITTQLQPLSHNITIIMRYLFSSALITTLSKRNNKNKNEPTPNSDRDTRWSASSSSLLLLLSTTDPHTTTHSVVVCECGTLVHHQTPWYDAQIRSAEQLWGDALPTKAGWVK